MALAYRSDRFTHDIDALILDNHTAVTQAVYDIARRRGLPTSWQNEQATTYMPSVNIQPAPSRGDVSTPRCSLARPV